MHHSVGNMTTTEQTTSQSSDNHVPIYCFLGLPLDVAHELVHIAVHPRLVLLI